MTVEKIKEAQALEVLKHETAVKIRTLLDQAVKAAKGSDYEEAIESDILDLVVE